MRDKVSGIRALGRRVGGGRPLIPESVTLTPVAGKKHPISATQPHTKQTAQNRVVESASPSLHGRGRQGDTSVASTDIKPKIIGSSTRLNPKAS